LPSLFQVYYGLIEAFFGSLFVLEQKYIIIIIINVMVAPAYDMFLCIQRFEYKYKLVAILSLIIPLASVFLSIFLIHYMEDHLLARTIGNYLPTFITSLIMYIYFIFKGRHIKICYCKYAIPIAVPYVFHLLAGNLLNSSDKAVITKIAGPSENALYSLAYSVGLFVSVIWSAMNSAFAPWLGEKLNAKHYSAIKRYTYGYVSIFACGVVVLMLFAPEALMILGGNSYYEAKYCVPPVMVGYFFFFLYSLYVNVEQFNKVTVPMAITTCIAAGINIVSNIVFVNLYGYIAAAYTTLGCYLLLTLFHYIIVKKMHLDIIYDTKFLVLISVFICFAMFISLFVYEYMILRYLLILLFVGVLLGILIKNREQLFDLLIKKKNTVEN